MLLSHFKVSKPAKFAIGFISGIGIGLLLSFYTKEDPPACVISNDMLNTLYIGLDNPLSILARGIPSDQLTVTCSGGGMTLQHNQDYKYTARVTTPGEATITVSDGNGRTRFFNFKIKRMADPVPLLGGHFSSREMESSLFKVQKGIAAIITGFDFDARCTIVEYLARRVAKNEEGASVLNKGAYFELQVKQLVGKAEPGNQYFFDDVKARCPGDLTPRNLGSLTFKIK